MCKRPLALPLRRLLGEYDRADAEVAAAEYDCDSKTTLTNHYVSSSNPPTESVRFELSLRHRVQSVATFLRQKQTVTIESLELRGGAGGIQ